MAAGAGTLRGAAVKFNADLAGAKKYMPSFGAVQTLGQKHTLTIRRKHRRAKILANKIKCSHILVQKQSEALAAMERLRSGEKFGKLARELSTDKGSAKKDGSLGYFTRGMMVKPFEEAAFKLQVGQTSEPVKSEFGYHIIKRFG